LISEWSRRLERRFGGWAFPQLASFIIFMNAAIWILSMLKPEFPYLLTLEPTRIMHGQVWRLFTFLFIPPAMSPLWMIFWLLLLFQFAQALEHEWGDFQFNMFYGIGAAATIGVSFWLGVGLSNLILNASLFLAFATLYPDFELLIFFILPVKVKWLALLTAAPIAWSAIAGSSYERWAVAAGLANYAAFFGPGWIDKARHRFGVWQNRRRFRG